MNPVLDKINAAASRALRLRTARLRNSRPIVSFTFDDFPRSAVAHGAGILDASGVHGTFYLARVFCDATVDGMEYYTLDDVGRLLRAGHEIGCHTAAHVAVSGLDRPALLDQLEINQRFMSEQFGDILLRSFAYPFGSVSLRSKMILQNRFASCRSIFPESNVATVDLGLVRAVSLYEHRFDRATLQRLLGGLRANSWLVFYTHDVDPLPSAYGVSPDLFAYAVDTAAKMGHEILPMKNALGRAAFA